ncbi:PIN-domain and Zn ribbon [Halanaeroarchaeum sp. HSR-CO]|uniref:Mut7-C RNAse domain-containing protein n=1 Tax=Halanaeroarchaeum sp. HSR-CO TaxID=2866382 RepID=UPI00217CF81D|nr:Mut7-C RNAse domain-containing protein [Halanaeroarchaeum sp. HSR-CO]UWG47297.1 PIN-domain and Zn ribbon [Halanaeroarchaeum sp. HSR-CO]
MPTPEDTRLLLDAMVGGIRTILRMVGYDTAYALERGVEADDAVKTLAESEGRVLLTRDVTLADRTDDAVLLHSKDADDQLAELAAAGFELTLSEPRRCAACNGALTELPDGAETPEDAPDPANRQCWRCRDCGQLFWKGSHWDDVADRIERL